MSLPNLEQPDLDTEEHINRFVELFYQKLLNDPELAPVFLRDAKIDVTTHLSTISLYWQKMLWGDKQYKTNMMWKHRRINAKRQFSQKQYQRWLTHFESIADQHFAGEYTNKALRIARAVISNMEKRMLDVVELPEVINRQV